jgi:hypothetical protein
MLNGAKDEEQKIAKCEYCRPVLVECPYCDQAYIMWKGNYTSRTVVICANEFRVLKRVEFITSVQCTSCNKYFRIPKLYQ